MIVSAAILLLSAAQAESVPPPSTTSQSADVVGQELAKMCEPGLYLIEDKADNAEPISLTAKPTEQRKVSNLMGFMVTGGISGMKVKIVLAGPAASVHTTAERPAFRFCFAPEQSADAAATVGSAYVGARKASRSPRDYALVRFETKSKKNREVAILKTGMLSSEGALSDSVVAVTIEQEGPHQFRVTPSESLAPGEYGFIRGADDARVNVQAGTKSGAEIVYDFGVKPTVAH